MGKKYFEFYAPVKILQGEYALENLANEIQFLGCSKPLLLTDKGLRKVGVFHIVLDSLKEQNMEDFLIFDDVPPDSDLNTCKEVAKLYRDTKRDVIVAVGGGSVIDTAKGANILISENIDDLKDFAGANVLKRPLKPLVVVPTTAGTGSEATCAAVIKDRERDVKMLFVSPYLIPNVAILDVRMTETLPPFLTAATAMDALSHAIEAYISIQKNPISDVFAFKAIEIISKNLEKVLENPKDREGRLALATSALMAGIAFSNAMVGLVHAIGHATGAVANVHHGVCMNIFLPYVLRYNFEKIKEELSELLLPLGGEEIYLNTRREDRPQVFIETLMAFRERVMKKSGIPGSLKEAGVKKESFHDIAELALRDGSLSFNVKDADYDDIMKILEWAY